MNEYQQREMHNAQVMSHELKEYYPTYATWDEDNNTPLILMTANHKTYSVRKDYKGNIELHTYPHKIYPNISNTTRIEIIRRYPTQNMRVHSKKKIDAKIQAQDAIDAEYQKITTKSNVAHARYLKKIESTELPFHYTKKRDTQEIEGGYVTRGNLTFTFTFLNDGYIQERTEIHRNYQLGIDEFLAMSDNHYQTDEK